MFEEVSLQVWGGFRPPVFGRSVNPILTGGGAHYPHPVLLAPPDFQTLRRACIGYILVHSKYHLDSQLCINFVGLFILYNG